jgi:hypothetical protein
VAGVERHVSLIVVVNRINLNEWLARYIQAVAHVRWAQFDVIEQAGDWFKIRLPDQREG